jgi:hypothetical protein
MGTIRNCSAGTERLSALGGGVLKFDISVNAAYVHFLTEGFLKAAGAKKVRLQGQVLQSYIR